ncbi:MAG: hypothetical protein K0R57_1555 [Paenibacillaceae bacterium]|jgi:predicted RNase H-like nuclease (RuvC/YqgF family)|nr:hypothetical protein [Paenibacillaceae bacterium]
MSLAPIYFQFSDKKSALLAVDTLQEVGFTAGVLEQRHPEHTSVIHVLVDRADLASALEIVQAHGGQLCETEDAAEQEVYTNAYSLDSLPGAASRSQPEEEQQKQFDPSEQDYDHFSAGVHL